MARVRSGAYAPMDVDLPGVPAVYALIQAPNGAIAAGFSTTGSAVAAATSTVTNTGTARAYPTLVLTGPTSGSARAYQLLNTTTGRAIYLNLTIQAGETVTLTFDPAALSFTSDFRGNIADAILPGSQESDFFLQPGANTMTLLVSSSTVTATLRWRPTVASLDDL
ncbi:hypothetical protein SE17_17195 [Kouleothrix aurantiaca]|uniref:Siphovirus-type tail component C-terminal domain-containing protein n=1 Tax=Kouleothrix aurantiaca TaxID=186479 RepID=A0A0P9D9H3_9CHLR|nr:hypothetical protein SE17_17195 [Kouleothrix aurantiaca]